MYCPGMTPHEQKNEIVDDWKGNTALPGMGSFNFLEERFHSCGQYMTILY